MAQSVYKFRNYQSSKELKLVTFVMTDTRDTKYSYKADGGGGVFTVLELRIALSKYSRFLIDLQNKYTYKYNSPAIYFPLVKNFNVL